ncbi:GDP-fucose protein O-fucosyltransferase [Tanacetum coccineum]
MRKMGKHYVALHLRYALEASYTVLHFCNNCGVVFNFISIPCLGLNLICLHFQDAIMVAARRKSNNPDKERRCPLTPEEVGLMVRALGYSKDVHLYVASGEVYGGDETIAPLRALFPNIHSKDAITTKDELEPFSKFSSRMAALDFIVCDESDVFVTNNHGNGKNFGWSEVCSKQS